MTTVVLRERTALTLDMPYTDDPVIDKEFRNMREAVAAVEKEESIIHSLPGSQTVELTEYFTMVVTFDRDSGEESETDLGAYCSRLSDKDVDDFLNQALTKMKNIPHILQDYLRN